MERNTKENPAFITHSLISVIKLDFEPAPENLSENMYGSLPFNVAHTSILRYCSFVLLTLNGITHLQVFIFDNLFSIKS